MTARAGTTPSTDADVVNALVLLEGAFGLVAGLGMVVMMGGKPLYLLVPAAKLTALLIFATKALRGRRWAMIALIVTQAVSLLGFELDVLVGLLPQVQFTINLVGLLTGVAMPVAVIWLCARLLAASARKAFAVPAGPGLAAPSAPIAMGAPR
jgi:hypothetical protein